MKKKMFGIYPILVTLFLSTNVFGAGESLNAPTPASGPVGTSVTIRGNNYLLDKDIQLGFDPVGPMNLSPINGTTLGVVGGSVKARSDGSWEATFTIPVDSALGGHNIGTFYPGFGPADGTASFTVTASTGTIKVYVGDQANSMNIISNATVKLMEDQNKTPMFTGGYYVFSNINPGSWTVDASAPGYSPKNEFVTNLTAGEERMINIGLMPSITGGVGNISGVINYAGTIHGNLRVIIFENPGSAPIMDVNFGSVTFPYTYTVNNVSSGTRYVKAKFEMNGIICAMGQYTGNSFVAINVPAGGTASGINIDLGGTPAHLMINPMTGPSGTNVNIDGCGFVPNEQIQKVLWKWTGGELVLNASPFSADSNGHFNFAFGVPSNITANTSYQIVVISSSFPNGISGIFNVTSSDITIQPINQPADISIVNIIMNQFLVTNPNNLANQPDAKPFEIQCHAKTTGYVVFELNFGDSSRKLYFRARTIELQVGNTGAISFIPFPGFFREVWSDSNVTKLPAGIYTFEARVVSGTAGSNFSISIPVSGDITTQPTVLPPFLISPIDSIVPNSNPTFVWTPVTGANKYKIFIGLNQDPEVDSWWTTEVDHPITQIIYPAGAREFTRETKYFWKVQSLQLDASGILKPIGGTNGKSNIASFRVGSGLTNIITIGPQGEIPGPVMFIWTPVPNTFSYELVLSNDPSMSNVIWKTQIPATNAMYPPDAPQLEENVKYFWGVVALDQNGQRLGINIQSGTGAANWAGGALASEVRAFSIKKMFDMMRIDVISPRGEANFPLMFIWNPQKDIFNYRIAISDRPDGLSNPIWSMVVPGANMMYPPDGPVLEKGKEYFWGVLGVDRNGNPIGGSFEKAPKSEITRFAVRGDTAGYTINTINVMSPKGDVGSPLMFIWSPIREAFSYKIAVSDRPDGLSSPIWTTVIQGASVMYPPDTPQLEKKKEYFWGVVALDKDGNPIGGTIESAPKSEIVRFVIIEGDTSTTMPRPDAGMLPPSEIERILRDFIKDPKILEELKDFNLIGIFSDPMLQPHEIQKILEELRVGEAEVVGVKVEEK